MAHDFQFGGLKLFNKFTNIFASPVSRGSSSTGVVTGFTHFAFEGEGISAFEIIVLVDVPIISASFLSLIFIAPLHILMSIPTSIGFTIGDVIKLPSE